MAHLRSWWSGLSRRGHVIVVAAVVVVLLVAVGSAGASKGTTASSTPATGTPAIAAGTSATAATATTGPTAEATPTPTPTATPAPTGPKTYKIGDTALSDRDGVSVKITVSDVAVAATYKGTYTNDTPQVAGNVFISAKVTYEAVSDGVNYNPADWAVFCDNTAVTGYTFVLNGPKPPLGFGSLTAGRKAVGYVIYEVPAKGEVRMSYKAVIFDTTPTFEVVIRAS